MKRKTEGKFIVHYVREILTENKNEEEILNK